MSLRARLIGTLLALATVGLVTLAVITYATQRSFQLEKIDDQTLAAEPAIDHELRESGVGAPDHGRSGGRGRGPGGGGPGPADASLPPGTYGELRDASGTVIGEPVVLSYGQAPLSAPALPARLKPGRPVTVPSKDGALDYRVRAIRRREGRP